MKQEIAFIQREELKVKPDSASLGFGKYYSDYMFVMDYHADLGWHDPRIIPYAPLTLDPAAMVFTMDKPSLKD